MYILSGEFSPEFPDLNGAFELYIDIVLERRFPKLSAKYRRLSKIGQYQFPDKLIWLIPELRLENVIYSMWKENAQ